MRDRPNEAAPWLLLVHQLPAEPSRLRVRVWRRLQSVGAVALKRSVYALPNITEAREDFEWIRTEIVDHGGEALVFTARAAEGVTSAQIRSRLERARESDWLELLDRCGTVGEEFPTDELDRDARLALRRRVRTLRAAADRIDRIDPLGAPGRRRAVEAVRALERRVVPSEAAAAGEAPRDAADYQRRRWHTRPRPGVDRMACAWLVRRFIDREASFSFGDDPPDDGAIPFDMYGVELGHRGDRVTFETLLREFGLGSESLARVARIVHELDLRLDDPSDAEAATVRRLVDGLRATIDDDARLLEAGMGLFEALHASFEEN